MIVKPDSYGSVLATQKIQSTSFAGCYGVFIKTKFWNTVFHISPTNEVLKAKLYDFLRIHEIKKCLQIHYHDLPPLPIKSKNYKYKEKTFDTRGRKVDFADILLDKNSISEINKRLSYNIVGINSDVFFFENIEIIKL